MFGSRIVLKKWDLDWDQIWRLETAVLMSGTVFKKWDRPGTDLRGLGPRVLGLESFRKRETKAGTKFGGLGTPFSCLGLLKKWDRAWDRL